MACLAGLESRGRSPGSCGNPCSYDGSKRRPGAPPNPQLARARDAVDEPRLAVTGQTAHLVLAQLERFERCGDDLWMVKQLAANGIGEVHPFNRNTVNAQRLQMLSASPGASGSSTARR